MSPGRAGRRGGRTRPNGGTRPAARDPRPVPACCVDRGLRCCAPVGWLAGSCFLGGPQIPHDFVLPIAGHDQLFAFTNLAPSQTRLFKVLLDGLIQDNDGQIRASGSKVAWVCRGLLLGIGPHTPFVVSQPPLSPRSRGFSIVDDCGDGHTLHT